MEMEETFVLEQVLVSLHRRFLHSPAGHHREHMESSEERVTLWGNGRNGLPKGHLKAAAVPSVCRVYVCACVSFNKV